MNIEVYGEFVRPIATTGLPFYRTVDNYSTTAIMHAEYNGTVCETQCGPETTYTSTIRDPYSTDRGIREYKDCLVIREHTALGRNTNLDLIDPDIHIVNRGKNIDGRMTHLLVETIIPIAILHNNDFSRFDEATNLMFFIKDKHKEYSHPARTAGRELITPHVDSFTQQVILVDPLKEFGTIYANVGGEVYPIARAERKNIKEPCVIIRKTDATNTRVIEKLIPLKDVLTHQDGVGIRFYPTKVEANEDKNNPLIKEFDEKIKNVRIEEKRNAEEYIKAFKKKHEAAVNTFEVEKAEWSRNKDGIIKAAVKKATTALKKKVKSLMNKLTKLDSKFIKNSRDYEIKADTKLRQAESISRSTHNKSQSDNAGMISSGLKVAGAAVAFGVGLKVLSFGFL